MKTPATIRAIVRACEQSRLLVLLRFAESFREEAARAVIAAADRGDALGHQRAASAFRVAERGIESLRDELSICIPPTEFAQC